MLIDRAAAGVEQVGDPVLAAQEDRLEVDVLDSLPGLDRRLEHRGVVVGRDPGVVEEHVYVPELLARPGVHALDLLEVGDVGLDRQVALGPRREVHSDDGGPLLREQPRGLGSDPARGAGYHADLALEPSRHQPSSVLKYTFLTSV